MSQGRHQQYGNGWTLIEHPQITVSLACDERAPEGVKRLLRIALGPQRLRLQQQELDQAVSQAVRLG